MGFTRRSKARKSKATQPRRPAGQPSRRRSVFFLSPGLSYAFTRTVQAYGFVQLPVYQDVNGVQLVARHAFVAGLNVRF